MLLLVEHVPQQLITLKTYYPHANVHHICVTKPKLLLRGVAQLEEEAMQAGVIGIHSLTPTPYPTP